MDKTTAAERPLVKKGSEKTFKLPEKLSTSTTAEADIVSTSKVLPITSTSAHSNASHQNDLEGEEDVAFELPPPMKPIQDSQAIISNGSAASSSVNAEQSPCKRVRYFGLFRDN